MTPGSSERTNWQELSRISGLRLLLLPSHQFRLHNSPSDFVKVQYSTYRKRICSDVHFWARTLEESCGIPGLAGFVLPNPSRAMAAEKHLG